MSTLDDLAMVIDRIPFLGTIRGDLSQLRNVLIDRRAPRVLALGAVGSGRTTIANELLAAAALASPGGAPAADGGRSGPWADELHNPEGQWIHVRAAGRSLDWLELEATSDGALDVVRADRLERALAEAAPDVILAVVAAPASIVHAQAIAETLKTIEAKLAAHRKEGQKAPTVLGVLTHVDRPLRRETPRPEGGPELVEVVDASAPEHKAAIEHEVHALKVAMDATQIAAPRPVACALGPGLSYGLEALADEIYVRLPDAAQVEAARAFPVSRDKKREIARLVVHRASTIAVTIGLAPVPFSDALILVPLQGLMVTAVAYVGGQPWDTRAAAEWMTSLGVLGAAAFGLRWGAQQLVKLVPGAGTLLSASVAGTGTLAIGRSAIAYFIDGPGLRRPRALLPASAS